MDIGMRKRESGVEGGRCERNDDDERVMSHSLTRIYLCCCSPYVLLSRLCGDMFCGSCTGRYHIPLVYEQKSKKGATRVCIGCRDSCLSQKDREKNATLAQQPQKHAVLSSKDLNGPIGAAAIRPSQFVGGPTPIEIAPPQWDDPDKFSDCAKCHKKGGKLHSQETRTPPERAELHSGYFVWSSTHMSRAFCVCVL